MAGKSKLQPSTIRRPSGGAATGGGLNFQAVVTAIAGVHLLRGSPIGWLEGVADDTPVTVWAETNGPGDDVRLELTDGSIAEIQAKKGLARGTDLWNSLLAMAEAVRNETIAYGILAIAPDSSGTIREDLSKDIRRLGDGRDDDLSEIGQDFLERLKAAGLPASEVCRGLRVQVVHGLDADGVGIVAAKEVLRHICADESDADAAWDALFRDAVAIIERRGRWQTSRLIRLLRSTGIHIRAAKFPSAVAAQLARWVAETNSGFSIVGCRKLLPLHSLLPMKTVVMPVDAGELEEPAEALERYRAFGDPSSLRDERVFVAGA